MWHLDCEAAKKGLSNKPRDTPTNQEIMNRIRPQSETSTRNGKKINTLDTVIDYIILYKCNN